MAMEILLEEGAQVISSKYGIQANMGFKCGEWDVFSISLDLGLKRF